MLPKSAGGTGPEVKYWDTNDGDFEYLTDGALKDDRKADDSDFEPDNKEKDKRRRAIAKARSSYLKTGSMVIDPREIIIGKKERRFELTALASENYFKISDLEPLSLADDVRGPGGLRCGRGVWRTPRRGQPGADLK